MDVNSTYINTASEYTDTVSGQARGYLAQQEEQSYRDEIRRLKNFYRDRVNADAEYNAAIESLQAKHIATMQRLNNQALKQATLQELYDYREEYLETLRNFQATNKELTEQQQKDLQKKIIDTEQNVAKLSEIMDKVDKGEIHTIQQKMAYLEKYANLSADLYQLEQQRQRALKADESGEFTDNINAQYDKLRKQQIQNAGINPNTIDEDKQKQMTLIGGIVSVLRNINNTVTSIKNSVSSQLTDAINIVADNMGVVNTRLYGMEDLDFSALSQSVQDGIGISAYVSQKKLLETMVSLVDRGITYNIEQRALISTISDKLVTTFDALDSTLTRLIRIQQADTTMTQLGAEARLTEFFNQMFGNTEYLGSSGGSGVYDTVYSALLEALSQMDVDTATQFNYSVQKWLGSLYAVGFSDSAISSIAEGINYLATGNIEALAGNSALQTLFAMSAGNAGLSYSELLTSGINATEIDSLMKSMVEYLQSISENTSNNVTKSAFSQLLNISVADLQAVQNLSASDLSTIESLGTLTYNDAYSSAVNQFSQIDNRTHSTEKISNVISNFVYRWGTNLAENNTLALAIWELSDIVTTASTALGIKDTDAISGVLSNFATIVSLGTTIKDLFDTGGELSQFLLKLKYEDSAENSLFKMIGNALTKDSVEELAGIFNGYNFLASGGYDWNAVTSRGSLDLSDLSGLSYSVTVGTNANTASSYSKTLGTEATSTSGSDIEYNKSVTDLFTELFINQTYPIRVVLAEFEDRATNQLYVEDQHDNLKLIKEKVYTSVPTYDTEYAIKSYDAEEIINTLDSQKSNSTVTSGSVR